MANARTGNSFSDLSCSWIVNSWAQLLSSLLRQWRGCLEVQDDVPSELFFAYDQVRKKMELGEAVRNPSGLVRFIAHRRLQRKYEGLRTQWQYEVSGGIAVETFESLKARDAPAPENPYIEKVADVIASLPSTQQALAKLVFVDGRSYAEIAQVMGKSEAAIKQSVYRIRRRIQTELGV